MHKILIWFELNSTVSPLAYVVLGSGKDQIIFVTKEDHETPSSAELMEEDLDDPYEERGVEHWLLTSLKQFFCFWNFN